MLDPSPRLKREALRVGCDPNHIILADLILSGYTDAEAYDIAYSEMIAASAKVKIDNRDRVFASEGYKRAYDSRKSARQVEVTAIEDRGKEDVLRELNDMATRERDVKMKAELLMKIAEIKQMKKDVTIDDEDPVQFFFPLSCVKCPLLEAYNDFIKKRNSTADEDEHDDPLRADEVQRLIEQADTRIRTMRAIEKAGY